MSNIRIYSRNRTFEHCDRDKSKEMGAAELLANRFSGKKMKISLTVWYSEKYGELPSLRRKRKGIHFLIIDSMVGNSYLGRSN